MSKFVIGGLIRVNNPANLAMGNNQSYNTAIYDYLQARNVSMVFKVKKLYGTLNTVGSLVTAVESTDNGGSVFNVEDIDSSMTIMFNNADLESGFITRVTAEDLESESEPKVDKFAPEQIRVLAEMQALLGRIEQAQRAADRLPALKAEYNELLEKLKGN